MKTVAASVFAANREGLFGGSRPGGLSRRSRGMRNKSLTVGVVVVVALALALGYVGLRMLDGERDQACAACGRPVHAQARVVGLVDGESRTFCCAACLLMDHRQTGQNIDVVELTDYSTHSALDPDEAFLVVGSSVNHCLRHEPLLDQHRTASRLDFDRCSPSVLAFSSEGEARAFVVNNGGRLSRFEELAGSMD